MASYSPTSFDRLVPKERLPLVHRHHGTDNADVNGRSVGFCSSTTKPIVRNLFVASSLALFALYFFTSEAWKSDAPWLQLRRPPVAMDTETKPHQLPTVYDHTARPTTANCSQHWIEQRIDHFAWLPAHQDHHQQQQALVDTSTSTSSGSLLATFRQRYFVYDAFWDPSNAKAPVFFYCGNEGDVTRYVNHTGLMWEHAQSFGALLVFAEHRYYGQSLPFEDHFLQNLPFLTHEQALADFAELLFAMQRDFHTRHHPVIAFGGSYGGELATWLRMKYPSLVHGAIASSAPLFGFPEAFPFFHDHEYWQRVTFNAAPEAGASANCAPNVRRAWPKLFEMATSEQGRTRLSEIFGLCEPLASENQVRKLAMVLLQAFDTMAMGNYPFESSYMTDGIHPLPAWPMRQACAFLKDRFEANELGDEQLLQALYNAASVYTNASRALPCLTLVAAGLDQDGVFDFQMCTERMHQQTYFSSNGVTDMFWQRNISLRQIQRHCQDTWHVVPDPTWIRVLYGDQTLPGASNIVFTYGEYDPWTSGGLRELPSDANERGLDLIFIEQAAHHLDLFFTDAQDSTSLREARQRAIGHVRKWIQGF